MPRTFDSRTRRRKKQRTRGYLILASLFLVFALIVAAFVWLVCISVDALTVPDYPAPDELDPLPVPTTTAYPTLNADETAGKISMNNVILYDATHDTVLYEQNADQQAYPASTTKLLTAILACQYGDPNATYTIGTEQDYVVWDASRAFLEEGVEYSFSDMLDGLLLPSGADAAYCLAVNVARRHESNPNLSDEEAIKTFVGYMNDYAASLGCTDYHFVTPDGYHDENHYCTARDMLKISQNALLFPEIRRSVSSATNEQGGWTNGNALVVPDSGFYYEYATGLKTGTTPEAGFCLASCAERNGVQLIAVVFMSDNPDARFTDSQTLFEQGFYLAEHLPTTAVPRLFNYLTTAAPTEPTEANPAA